MGRGGSGNWYEPKVLAQTGQFSAPEAPETIKPLRADKEVVTDTRRRGRGGAGNFVWDEEGEELPFVVAVGGGEEGKEGEGDGGEGGRRDGK